MLLVLENRFGSKGELIKDVEELSRILKKEIFPGWVSQPTARKNIERELRMFLRKKYINKPYGIAYKEIDNLSSKLKEDVETYGKAG